MYYIYAYIDPRTNLPFYIGKGTGTRKFDHLRESEGKTSNKDKLAILRELSSNNLTPNIVELENNISSEAMAYNREDYYILFYGRRGFEENGILSNKTIGGQHPPTPIWDAAKRKAHSDFNTSYWTTERRAAHGKLTQGNSGGKCTAGTVNVTDLNGVSKRIPKEMFDSMNKEGSINTWEYVSVSSKEAKRRRTSP